MTAFPGGVHLEIIERGAQDTDLPVVLPNRVVINGQEVLIPEDSEITVGPIGNHNVVTVTLTMFVASLSIRRDGDAPA